MNISLPDDLREFVEERVAQEAYTTSSEYIRELIRKDRARTKLRALIVEGLESPPVGEINDEYWAAKRKLIARKK